MGLKVLRRFYRDPTTLFQRALAALEHGTNIEQCGATHELLCAFDDPAHRFLSALSDDSIATLRQRLEAASRPDVGRCIRDNATIALRLLGDFEADRTSGLDNPAQTDPRPSQGKSPPRGTSRGR
jgi:hypothetical protein